MTCFKKIYPTIILLLITSMGGAYENSPIYGETENSFCCQPACCGNGFVRADLLYWRAFQDGLDICIPTAVSDTIAADGTIISRFKGRGRDPHFDWNPGFRIIAEYEPLCCQWDFATSWTHFHTNAHASRCNNRLRWGINFDVADILAGYKFDGGPCFSVGPFAGIRMARIDQHLHNSTLSGSLSSHKHHKEDFLGVGPLIGLEADWNALCNVSLYANASISWLYGKFDIRLADRNTSVGSISCCRIKKHLNASVVAADAGVGIRWERCYCENKRLILQFGLEHHRYFDFNRIGNHGDLSFDGVNFSLGIEF